MMEIKPCATQYFLLLHVKRFDIFFVTWVGPLLNISNGVSQIGILGAELVI